MESQAAAKCAAIKMAIADVSAGMNSLKALLRTVDDMQFAAVREEFERLESVCKAKTTIDAAFAFVAQRDDAGRVVGSTRAKDYLTSHLKISENEAFQRLRNGERLYAVEDEPEMDLGPEPEPEPLPEPGESEEERARREEERARREEERRKAEEEARERAAREREEKRKLRRKLAEENAERELLAMIERELNHLNKFAVPGQNQLYNQALEYSKEHTHEETRSWLRDQIRKANRRTRTPFHRKDPYAAMRKRYVSFKRDEIDGGAELHGYLDAATATLVGNALAAARNPGTATLLPEDDERTFGQRMHDRLAEVFGGWTDNKQASGSGFGSFVISATVQELAEMTSQTYLPTNIGTYLSPLDLLRLGKGLEDYLCIMDDTSFLPLALGRTSRTASLAQRIALAAAELVCSHPGCERPAIDCDVHHMQAWTYGGVTDLANLTLRCRSHHVNNNDRRDGFNNMGYADRDPLTGRTGHRGADGELRFNDSNWSQQSASAKLRAQAEERVTARWAAEASAGPPDGGPPGAGPFASGPPSSGPPNAGPPDAGSPGTGLPDTDEPPWMTGAGLRRQETRTDTARDAGNEELNTQSPPGGSPDAGEVPGHSDAFDEPLELSFDDLDVLDVPEEQGEQPAGEEAMGKDWAS